MTRISSVDLAGADRHIDARRLLYDAIRRYVHATTRVARGLNSTGGVGPTV